MIGHEGQVRNDVSSRRSPHDGAGVIDNVVDRDRHCRLVLEHNHPERVANKNEVNARPLDYSCRRHVIRREHDQILAPLPR